MQLQGELSRDDVLRLLGSLCGLYRIPFDAALIAQSHPSPYTLVTLHEAARAFGHQDRRSRRRPPRLAEVTLSTYCLP